jgi:transposase InsO family protein
MSQGNRATTLQQRLEISDRAERGETDPQIATALHLSPATVRKWRRCAQRTGRSGLSSHLGRPRTGALGQTALELRDAVRELRQAHPGWGPPTLRLELAHDRRFGGLRIPSRARLAAFLKVEKLTRRHARHSELVQPAPQPATAPHEVWEMDAQGVRLIDDVGRVSVINIGDPYSHLRTESLACLHKIKPATYDYQLALRRAMLRFGQPKRLSLDHDSAFYDNTSPSPYPSRLQLWAIALGIEVVFIHKGRPTEHGFIERTHQIVDDQALLGRACADPAAIQLALAQRLDFLNTQYPSRALTGQPPLAAYPAAAHSGRPYRPEYEAELLDLDRVYRYLAQNRWFRQVSTPGGQFTLGTCRYGLGRSWADQEIEITFDPQTQEFVCRSEDGQATQRLSAKGLTKADLLGELDMTQFSAYQYAFPWSADVCRLNLLHQEMTGTTL